MDSILRLMIEDTPTPLRKKPLLARPQNIKTAMGPTPPGAGLVPVTEDTPVDMLAGSMFISTYLPDGRVLQTSIARSTAMMDILVRFTTEHGLAPGDHLLHALDSRGQPLPYKPSTPLGALDVWSIHIVSKPKPIPGAPAGHSHLTNFQHTFRLKVNLPRNQLYVVRVSPLTRFSDILKLVSRDKNLDPEKYLLRHPDDLSIVLSSLLRICDYEDLTEVTLVAKDASRNELVKLMEQRQQQRRRANTANSYTNPVLRHYRQTTACSAVNSQSTEGSGVSTESGRSPSPPPPSVAPLPPARPARKRRPAPRPPTQKASTNTTSTTTNSTPLGTKTEKKNSHSVNTHNHHHSRESSDSSGYHEPASLVSCSPNNTDTSPTCTLPRKQPTGKPPLQRPLSTPGDVKLSRSLCSLANAEDAASAGSTGSLTNMTTLPRKKKVAPPPPPPRVFIKTNSEPVITVKPVASAKIEPSPPVETLSETVEEPEVVASPAPVPRPRNVGRHTPPQPPPRSSPFGVGASLVRLSSSTTDIDDEGDPGSIPSTTDDFDEDLDTQLDMEMFAPARAKRSGEYLDPSSQQALNNLNSVNRELEESFNNDNFALSPSGDASDEDEGAGDSEIIDWEYRLPSPPSAFRDISGTRSPTIWTDATVPLADTQVFHEEEQPQSISPLQTPFDKSPPEEIPIPGSNGKPRLNPLYDEGSFQLEFNKTDKVSQLSKSLVDLRFEPESIPIKSSVALLPVQLKSNSNKSNTKVVANPQVPKEPQVQPAPASQVIAADQAQFKMPKLSNFKLTTYDGEAHRRKPPVAYTESNTGSTTVVRSGSFSTVRKNVNVAPDSPESETEPSVAAPAPMPPPAPILPPTTGLFQRKEQTTKTREIHISKPAQRSMSTRLPGENSLNNQKIVPQMSETKPIVRTKSIGSLYFEPGENEDVLNAPVGIRKATSQTALNKTDPWKSNSRTWQEELQSLAVLRTILPTLQQSSKTHDVIKMENRNASSTRPVMNGHSETNAQQTSSGSTTVTRINRWQPPSVALSTWTERARGFPEKESSIINNQISSTGSTTTVRIVDVKKKSPNKSTATETTPNPMGNHHTTVILGSTERSISKLPQEPPKTQQTIVVKTDSFKIPGSVDPPVNKPLNSVVFRTPRAPVVKGFRALSTAIETSKPSHTNRHSVPEFATVDVPAPINSNGIKSINIKSNNNIYNPSTLMLNNKNISTSIKKVAQVSPQSRPTSLVLNSSRVEPVRSTKKLSSPLSSSASHGDLLSAIRDFGGVRNLRPTAHRIT